MRKAHLRFASCGPWMKGVPKHCALQCVFAASAFKHSKQKSAHCQIPTHGLQTAARQACGIAKRHTISSGKNTRSPPGELDAYSGAYAICKYIVGLMRGTYRHESAYARLRHESAYARLRDWSCQLNLPTKGALGAKVAWAYRK